MRLSHLTLPERCRIFQPSPWHTELLTLFFLANNLEKNFAFFFESSHADGDASKIKSKVGPPSGVNALNSLKHSVSMIYKAMITLSYTKARREHMTYLILPWYTDRTSVELFVKVHIRGVQMHSFDRTELLDVQYVLGVDGARLKRSECWNEAFRSGNWTELTSGTKGGCIFPASNRRQLIALNHLCDLTSSGLEPPSRQANRLFGSLVNS